MFSSSVVFCPSSPQDSPRRSYFSFFDLFCWISGTSGFFLLFPVPVVFACSDHLCLSSFCFSENFIRPQASACSSMLSRSSWSSLSPCLLCSPSSSYARSSRGILQRSYSDLELRMEQAPPLLIILTASPTWRERAVLKNLTVLMMKSGSSAPSWASS